MRRYGSLLTIGLIATSLGFFGCDEQTSSDYQGEALASIKGTISNDSGATVEAAMALVYPTVFPSDFQSDDLSWVIKVPVTGSFPAHFKMDLYDPPPGLIPIHDGYHYDTPVQYRFAIQAIRAVAANSPDRPVKASDCIIGETGQEKYVVAYLDQDLLPGDLAPDADGGLTSDTKAIPYFGVSKAGYHLLRAKAFSSWDGHPVAWEEVPGGFSNELSVSLTRAPGPDCRPPRHYDYDGGIP